MCGICQSRVDGGCQIEVSVTVGIRTRELEKSLCRWMQYVRLVRGRLRAGTLKPQFKAQMLYGWKRDAQRHRSCSITTQPVSALLPCDGARRRKAHAPLLELPPEVGSGRVADASDWVVSSVSPRALGRADRRCCFSC
jgi:hypothetical protein